MINQPRIIMTDLDGTLFNANRRASVQDYQTLIRLGKRGIYRVAATGRSLYSTQKVLPPDFPIDYLIFSSGAGIMDWQTKELLDYQSLSSHEVKSIVRTLIAYHLDFMIHKPIPENHCFTFYESGNDNPDFKRRCQLYQNFIIPPMEKPENFGSACQLLGITNNNSIIYEKIKNELNQQKVIRTTSPLDGDSIWIEIFPKSVSKGDGAAWLCHYLDIDQADTVSIGNDYNDLDLLMWTEVSFVVANAPDVLKQRFNITEDNIHHPLTAVAEMCFKL